jgi:hypothetical protein
MMPTTKEKSMYHRKLKLIKFNLMQLEKKKITQLIELTDLYC